MLDSGLLISWGEVSPGRAQRVFRLFSEVVAYHDKLLEEGRISGFEPGVLGTHGGGLGGLRGFMIVRGTAEQIIALRRDDEFLADVRRAQMLVKDVGIDDLYLGEALRNMMAPVEHQVRALAQPDRTRPTGRGRIDATGRAVPPPQIGPGL